MIALKFVMDRWPLKQPFRFAGFTVTALDCAHVTLSRGGKSGQGEGVVPVVFDITVADVQAQLEQAVVQLKLGRRIEAVCAEMPPGPARNALDCAFWDLRAKETGKSIQALADLPPAPPRIEVDETIGLGTPEQMAAAARGSAHRVLKVKLDAEGVIDRIRAIRDARPDAKLIVDANQSWSAALLQEVGQPLADLGVRMIEQPVPRGQDEMLRGINCPVPLFADESCHTSQDVAHLSELYQGVNIKLDKTGGLTEALELVRAARLAGMGVMVGCMAGTSLSMAPAYVIASLSDWADLDGPLLLADDRHPAMTYENGTLAQYAPALWG